MRDEGRRDEVGEIMAVLKTELRAHDEARVDTGRTGEIRLRWLQRAQRLAGVSADRPYLHRAGALGRVRGTILVPPKAVLRRLMRWYVEPLAIDQRQFNAAILRVVDELTQSTNDELRRLRRAVDELGERIAELESRNAKRP